ncbi:GNAT family N-acetyltransferase [Fulvimarina endophytica]|uniref:GNAT family N-acetyltransferase n=1 Tax=Fulvimarina endophytica TaxID=2293836 RepID=A0A371XAZ5_9HYPH|nr:GNAT family N-acetyltransferase [Fulvimarina endophytica]RFC66403.1 GNAT family N-acetyltransferase [Fulvimarina endophytica]
MPYAIRAERFLGDDVRELAIKLDDALTSLAPPEYNFGLDFDEMTRADVTVFVCRARSGEAVAMGTLKDHGNGLGEVKRMFTEPEFRKRGLAQRILRAILKRAEATGLSRIVLETGSHEDYGPARTLYERIGFRECGPVLDYPASPHSRFYEKTLSA